MAPPGKQLHANPKRLGELSEDARLKGEAFVQAMLDEGRDYEAMKAAFLYCMVRFLMAKCNGVIIDAARLVKTHRNRLSPLVHDFKLKDVDKRQ